MSQKPSTSVETPCIADCIDYASRSPTTIFRFSDDAPGGAPPPHGAEHVPTGGTAGDAAQRDRWAWALTGSGHYLDEALELAFRLPRVDFFLSAAAEEVLPLYGHHIDAMKERFRVFRDKSASSVPVGMLYDDVYHTVVIAPATSNTVAKCAVGISDTLPTNMFAQAGKLGIPGIVFACDTEPVVVTKSPREWVELRPRNIDLENVARLRSIDHCRVVESLATLEQALNARLAELSLK